MKQFILTVLVIVFPSLFNAQTGLDSLKILLKNSSNDSTSIKLNLELGKQWKGKNIETSIVYFNTAIEISENNDWQSMTANLLDDIGEGLAIDRKKTLEFLERGISEYKASKDDVAIMRFYFRIGTLNYRYQNYPKAIELLHIAVKIGEKLNEEPALAKSYDNLGLAYKYSGQFDKAAIYQFKAINLFEKLGDKNIRKTHANIAVTYVQQGNYEKSIEHYKIALNLFLIEKEKHYAAFCYKNLGNVFALLEEHDSSLVYYNNAFEIYKELNDQVGISNYHMVIGVRYTKLGMLQEASLSHKRALETFPENGRTSLLFHIYNNLSGLNLKLVASSPNNNAKLFRENIEYGHKMHTIAEELGALDLIHLSLKVLYTAYNGVGNNNAAFEFSKKFIDAQDSLYFKQKQETITEMQTKYETKQKENEILILEAESTEQQLMIIYLISASLLLVILLVWFVYKRKLVENEKKVVILQKDKLKLQVEHKRNELVQKAMNIAHLQENNKLLVTDISDMINNSNGSGEKELKSLIIKLNSSSDSPKIWKEFELRFQEVHGDFYKNIIVKYSDLSPTELKIISLIKLNLNTKEIAEITSRSVRTIENTRNSIRKKMKLTPNENLATKILAY